MTMSSNPRIRLERKIELAECSLRALAEKLARARLPNHVSPFDRYQWRSDALSTLEHLGELLIDRDRITSAERARKEKRP